MAVGDARGDAKVPLWVGAGTHDSCWGGAGTNEPAWLGGWLRMDLDVTARGSGEPSMTRWVAGT